LLVAAAAGIYLAIDPYIHPSSPYALFYLAILGCAWFLGIGPAVMASLLSAGIVETLLIRAPEPTLWRLLPFAIACSGIIGIVHLARGIRTSEARANAQLAAIVHSTDDAIVSKDLNGIIQNCNPACERLFGYSVAELVGRPITMLIPPELQAEEPLILERLRRGERIEHFETVRVTKDGRRLDVSLTISPVRNAQGEVIGVSKIARDITETKAAARRLAAQEEWFRVTLGSISDAVITTDPTGRITFLNATASRLTGWDPASAQGRPLQDVFHLLCEATREPVDDPVTAVLRHGQAVGGPNWTHDPVVLRARDGSERPIEDTGAPIRNREGDVIGVVLIFRDVSERRAAEAERLASAADRDRLLDSERSARAEAERANRVKDDFVAVVSHELRTPLNAIVGWTEVLLQGQPDQQGIRGLEVIRRNAQIQAQLIGDLLDISRVVSGKLLLDVQTVDLVSVMEGAVETVQHAADSKGITIRQRFSQASAGLLESAVERDQVHAARWPHRCRDAACRLTDGNLDFRQRHWHPARHARSHLRPLPSAGRTDDAPAGRPRPRPGDRSAPGRTAWRGSVGGQHGGRSRVDVHDCPARGQHRDAKAAGGPASRHSGRALRRSHIAGHPRPRGGGRGR
jgi:PAS domain S-box-containing protein